MTTETTGRRQGHGHGHGHGHGPPSFPSADVQELSGVKDESLSDWSPSLNQEGLQPPHVKEEEEEQWISQPQGLQGADAAAVPLTAVPVKSEDDEVKPLISAQREATPPTNSSARPMKTESDGGVCPKPDQDGHSQPNPDDQTSFCSEARGTYGDWQEPLSDAGPESEDSDGGWQETRTAESDALKHQDTPITAETCDAECGQRFHHKASLQRHTCRLGRRSPSLVVDETCKEKQRADSQVRVHKRKKRFGCNVCEKRFLQRSYLRRHMKVHTEEKPFGCDVCGKRFGERSKLNRHTRIHTQDKPFGCDVCGKRCTFKANLKTHMRVHTEEKPFSCDVCGKRFGERSKVNRHMRIHTEEKPFGCDVCGKCFNQKGSLQKHVRIHLDQKPFGCDVCGKTFSQKESLKTHMRVHTGEKPFGCDVCGKRCTFKASLKTHMRVHTGEKPFSCDFCGKRFSQASHLKMHVRIHTGENPFGCDVCGKRFNQKANLKTHMRVHSKDTHPEDPLRIQAVQMCSVLFVQV